MNIRATLATAVPDLITVAERDLLIDHARAAYFPERSFEALLVTGPVADWPAGRRTALEAFLSMQRRDQKREDAIVALRAVAREGAWPRRPRTAPPPGLLWKRERLAAEGFGPVIQGLNLETIAVRFGISTKEMRTLRSEASARFFISDWARANGIMATLDDLALARASVPAAIDVPEARRETLLRDRALILAAERVCAGTTSMESRRLIILDWASANGIERDGFEGDALVDWIVNSGPDHFGYVWQFDVEIVSALQLLGYATALTGLQP